MINQSIEYKISLFFSKIFDFNYNLVSIPTLCFLSGSNNKKRMIIFLNYISFVIINSILKTIIKEERPCVDPELDLDYCPPDYDIPSGHSLSGIYFSLLLIKKSNNSILNYLSVLPLLLQPFFRYFVKVHGLEGIIFGSLHGVIAYLFLQYIHNLVPLYKIKEKIKKTI